MTPLVLLPGMMCDARLFGPQIAAQVLAHAPPRFALAGLSMGGIVAMEVAAQAPERLAGLALLDTNPLAERPEVRARRAPQTASVRAGGLRAVMRDEMKPNYLAHGPERAAILDLCMDMAMGLGADVFVNQSLALRDRLDRQEALRALDCPALVLCGRDDALCPPDRHALMHELIAGSRLVVIEDAGHLPTLERPEETTAALGRWLDSVDA